MIIKLKNIDSFLDIITALLKVPITDARFIISDKGVKINSVNESKTLRTFIKSNCIVSNDRVELNFQDINKLKQSINLIRTIEDINKCDLDYNGSNLNYNNDVRFKLKTVEPDIVDRFVQGDLKVELETVFKIKTSSDDITKVIQCNNIINDDESKIYFIVKGNKIIGEVGDKTNELADTVGIPFGNVVEGSMEKPLIVTVNTFRNFGILKNDNITIEYTDKEAVKVVSTVKDNDIITQLMIICRGVKI